MSIKYSFIEGDSHIRDTKKRISKYFHAYEAVRQLTREKMAKIDFDTVDTLRGFQSQINCNLKFRGRYATKSENLTLYVWPRY